MVSFANDVNGNSPLYYLSITLSSNGGSGFQQMVTINSSNYSTYEAADLSNLNFQDGAGNILSSWLESGETNTSTSTNYWVKLPNGTITVIYLVFYSTSAISKDSVVSGAEPNYTATYGQYDNGSDVFDTYFNFAGTSTPTGITASGTTFNNGATVTSGSAFTTSTFGGSTGDTDIAEFLGNSAAASGVGVLGYTNSSASPVISVQSNNGYSTSYYACVVNNPTGAYCSNRA